MASNEESMIEPFGDFGADGTGQAGEQNEVPKKPSSLVLQGDTDYVPRSSSGRAPASAGDSGSWPQDSTKSVRSAAGVDLLVPSPAPQHRPSSSNNWVTQQATIPEGGSQAEDFENVEELASAAALDLPKSESGKNLSKVKQQSSSLQPAAYKQFEPILQQARHSAGGYEKTSQTAGTQNGNTKGRPAPRMSEPCSTSEVYQRYNVVTLRQWEDGCGLDHKGREAVSPPMSPPRASASLSGAPPQQRKRYEDVEIKILTLKDLGY